MSSTHIALVANPTGVSRARVTVIGHACGIAIYRVDKHYKGEQADYEQCLVAEAKGMLFPIGSMSELRAGRTGQKLWCMGVTDHESFETAMAGMVAQSIETASLDQSSAFNVCREAAEAFGVLTAWEKVVGVRQAQQHANEEAEREQLQQRAAEKANQELMQVKLIGNRFLSGAFVTGPEFEVLANHLQIRLAPSSRRQLRRRITQISCDHRGAVTTRFVLGLAPGKAPNVDAIAVAADLARRTIRQQVNDQAAARAAA